MEKSAASWRKEEGSVRRRGGREENEKREDVRRLVSLPFQRYRDLK